MGREKTGKRYDSFEDLERRWPRIPPGLINQILFTARLPIGIYGITLYGMCAYGIQYGSYGVGSYSDCYYQSPLDGIYGTGSYNDCNYY